jgi:hypothetical protein
VPLPAPPILTLLDFVDQTTGVAWLTRADMDNAIGASRVDDLCSDDGSGVANSTTLYAQMAKAEQKVVSLLLRAFTTAEIVQIMKSDQFARSSSADIAAEYMSRRKGDFTSEDGKGRYYTQFKEACEYFKNMSHGRDNTATPVSNAQQGGNVKPPLPDAQSQPFIFAPNNNLRFPGRGGF